MVESFDVAIVGAGACGAAAAWRLSKLPELKIACFEQGDFTDASEYPSIRADWELRRDDAFSPSPNIRRSLSDYPIDDLGSPIAIANFNAVGGSTILYSGHFPRFHPSDFRTKTLDGIGEDWPISFKELQPFFELNEKMMGVAGLVGDPANPDYTSLLPPVPLGSMGRRIAQAFNTLGWHWWPSYSAINTHKHQNRPRCINLGPCNTGCSQGAKASVDVTYWPIALRNGVTLRTRCRVNEILLDNQGLAKGITYFDRFGNLKTCEAKVIVLACNGIGTPRILLNSKSNAFPNGLANSSGLVGKNLMLHPLGYVECVFDRNLNSSIGPHGCCILSQQFYESDATRDFHRGYTMQVLRGAPPVETAIAGYLKRQIPIGSTHHRKFSETFNRTAGIAIITEDLPEATNCIELDYSRKDANGIPGVKVRYEISSNTKKMMTHGIEMSKKVLVAAGGRITTAFGPVKNSGWHLMGTVRMGESHKTSVVNKHGQAHSVRNLYVVDSSTFVTSGAVNPVATSQALTLFACEHIERRFRERC